MAILSTSNPVAQNRTDLLATKNTLSFQLGGLGEPRGTTKQAIIYTQANFDNTFSLPLNESSPLIAINKDNSYDFDLSAILKNAAIFPHISLPPDDFKVRTLKDFIVPFKVKTFEIGKPETAVVSQPMNAINCRLKNTLSTKGNFFSTLMPQDYSFLNVAPYAKKTSANAPEYLTFLFNISPCPSTVVIKFKIADYEDNSEFSVYETLNSVNENQAIEIDVSLKKVQQLSTFSEINFYNVQIFELKDDNSEKLIALSGLYYNDFAIEPEDEQILIYRTQLNAWETQRFLGATSISQEVTRQNFINSTDLLITYHVESFQKIILRTGPLEQSWLKYIGEELITSSEIYLIQNGAKIQLQCLTDSLVIHEDENADEFAEIEFRTAQTEINQ